MTAYKIDVEMANYKNADKLATQPAPDDIDPGARFCKSHGIKHAKQATQEPIQWTGGELDDETEIHDYKDVLSKHCCDTKSAVRELWTACHQKQDKRMAILLGWAKTQSNIDIQALVGYNANGDTLLHWAVTHNRMEVMRNVIAAAGKTIITKKSCNAHYEGATVLHLAVADDNQEAVDAMLTALPEAEKTDAIKTEATGTFFIQKLQCCGLPLTLALRCGHLAMFHDLLQQGANVDATDTITGNTAVHALVHYGKSHPEAAVEIIDRLLNSEHVKAWYCKKLNIRPNKFGAVEHNDMMNYLLRKENCGGYTPLSLAALLGVHSIISYILQIEGIYKFTEARFGDTIFSHYDMSEIDPSVTKLMHQGKPNVLELLVFAQGADTSPSLAIQPIKSLMKQKWHNNRCLLIFWLLYHVFIMCIFSSITLNRKIILEEAAAAFSSQYNIIDTNQSIYNLVGFSVVIVTSVIYILMEFVSVVSSLLVFIHMKYMTKKRENIYRLPYGVIFKPDIFRLIMFFYAVASITYVASEYEQLPNTRVALSIAVLLGWYFTLYFSRAFKPTGFFTLMVHRIIMTDLMRFAALFFIILVGFSVAMSSVVNSQSRNHSTDSMAELFNGTNSILSMFRVMVGLNDLAIDEVNDDFGIVLYVLFIVITMILLLNMLIAAMSDSYATLVVHKEDIWRKLRASIILLMESRNSSCTRRRQIEKYMKYDSQRDMWLLPVIETSYE